jgi:hypothetical protein
VPPLLKQLQPYFQPGCSASSDKATNFFPPYFIPIPLQLNCFYFIGLELFVSHPAMNELLHCSDRLRRLLSVCFCVLLNCCLYASAQRCLAALLNCSMGKWKCQSCYQLRSTELHSTAPVYIECFRWRSRKIKK